MSSQVISSNKFKRLVINKAMNLIPRLTDNQILKGINVEINEKEVLDIALFLPDILMTEPVCLQLDLTEPITIIGDIYGQYGHLLRILNYYGHPPEKKYLFLGNYINHGPQSIETILLLIIYKVCYPKSIYLLRGKHECVRLTKAHGFYKECGKRFSLNFWHILMEIFQYMPVMAILENEIFCVHSGISPMIEQFDIKTQTQFIAFIEQNIILPADIENNRLLMHFIWSDPDDETHGWDQNPCGQGYLYGSNAVEEFCKRIGVKQIVRSSELMLKGYEFFVNPRLLTIFSAPDFTRKYENDAAMLYLYKLDSELKNNDDNDNNNIGAQIRLIQPIIRLRCKPTLRMNIALNNISVNLATGTAVKSNSELTTTTSEVCANDENN
ncbi:unnamed protein product [Trichobilharzia szidati]|nr:unnamed protein product [Trichobilharzia szidati]